MTVANSNASLLSNTGTINIDIAASGISMINMSSSTSSSSFLSNEAAFAAINLIGSEFDGIKNAGTIDIDGDYSSGGSSSGSSGASGAVAGISLVHVNVGTAGIVNEGDISINSSVSDSASWEMHHWRSRACKCLSLILPAVSENSGTISVETASSSSSSSVSINLQGAGMYLGEGSISGGIDNSGFITVKQSSNAMQSSVEGGGIIIEDLDVTGGIDISGDITVSSLAQSLVSSRAEANAYGISFERRWL